MFVALISQADWWILFSTIYFTILLPLLSQSPDHPCYIHSRMHIHPSIGTILCAELWCCQSSLLGYWEQFWTGRYTDAEDALPVTPSWLNF